MGKIILICWLVSITKQQFPIIKDDFALVIYLFAEDVD